MVWDLDSCISAQGTLLIVAWVCCLLVDSLESLRLLSIMRCYSKLFINIILNNKHTRITGFSFLRTTRSFSKRNVTSLTIASRSTSISSRSEWRCKSLGTEKNKSQLYFWRRIDTFSVHWSNVCSIWSTYGGNG